MNNKAKHTIYDRYNCSNVSQCEDFVNIIRPDKTSKVYRDFIECVNAKVQIAMSWLSKKNIEYTWNERIEGHLYRIYIPEKDLLMDFEYYPVNNINYNYIRINYDTDIEQVLTKLFPEIVLDTSQLEVWKLNMKSSNRFLRENNMNPVYYKSVLHLALVKDTTIYQLMIIKDNKIIRNVCKRNCSIPYGTYILLRYLNEMFEIPEILITDRLDDSYTMSMYQLLNLPKIHQSNKQKIWWNSDKPKWHIAEDEKDNYISFYFTEQVTYRYPK